MGYVLSFWKRIFDVKGHISRKEFLVGYLGNALAVGVVSGILTTIFAALAAATEAAILGVLPVIVTSLLSLALSVAGITAMIRRLNDAGKPWYFIFLSFIPCVGGFILLYFLLAIPGMGGDGLSA